MPISASILSTAKTALAFRNTPVSVVPSTVSSVVFFGRVSGKQHLYIRLKAHRQVLRKCIPIVRYELRHMFWVGKDVLRTGGRMYIQLILDLTAQDNHLVPSPEEKTLFNRLAVTMNSPPTKSTVPTSKTFGSGSKTNP